MRNKNLSKCVVAILFLFSSVLSWSQPPAPYGPLPSQRQLNWQETEMYCIIHFSVATYTDKEWGYGDERTSIFTASRFNAHQIVAAAKAGGFKGIVVVAKHHDGFCLWPTKTTIHNIANSPFKNGKGDVVREYQIACKELKMKMGVYCSPWDRNNSFYGKSQYVEDIYRKQLIELYSNYGKLFMSWHDGANGGNGYYGGTNESRTIDRSTYYDWEKTWDITRRLQPGAAIFGDIGPDVRWIGNEEGYAGDPYWETYTPQAPEEGKLPANGYSKYQLATEGTRNGKYWIPAECDVPLRPGWFFHDSQNGQSKSSYQLLELYFKSVGRGACMDLGLAPNKDGLLAQEDVEKLKGFGTMLKEIYAVNFASGATFKASNIRNNDPKSYGPQQLLGNDRYSYWATDDGVHHPELLIQLKKKAHFNILRLRENIQLGQRIDSFVVDAWVNDKWQIITQAKSIGALRLLTFPTINTDRLRLRITGSPVCIALSDFGLFNQPEHYPGPVILRNRDQKVSLIGNAPNTIIRYTINGENPTIHSKPYLQPFELNNGGTIRAALFSQNKVSSDIGVKAFGMSTVGWQITIDSNPDPDLSFVLDNFDSTFWKAQDTQSTHQIRIDMRKVYKISAWSYTPPKSGSVNGYISRYKISFSADGKNWTNDYRGEFGNMLANPVQQMIRLNSPLSARYVRFTPLSTVDDKPATIGGLEIYSQ